MRLLLIFIIANIINVIIQTVKSICTIKCGKVSASVINALAYGFYTYIVILMSADLPLIAKCFIVGMCNLVGVYVVKALEEKIQKAKLWKVELTVTTANAQTLHENLMRFNIPHNYYTDECGKYTIFNAYCATKKQSHFTKEIAESARAKYFVMESKSL